MISPESPHPDAFRRFVQSSRKLQRVYSSSTARSRCIGLAAGRRAMNVRLSENAYYHGVVRGYWGSFPLPSSGSWLGVSQTSHLFTRHLPRVGLLLTKRGRWIFDNHVVILTLNIHWLGPPLFLQRCSEATRAIWGEPYQKTEPDGGEARTCNP